jgi:hypothetical protein
VSRLTEEVREKRGYAYSVYSYFAPLKQPGPFQIGLQLRYTMGGGILGGLGGFGGVGIRGAGDAGRPGAARGAGGPADQQPLRQPRAQPHREMLMRVGLRLSDEQKPGQLISIPHRTMKRWPSPPGRNGKLSANADGTRLI